MSVNFQIKPDGALSSSKAVTQPKAGKPVSIRARVILGIIILWAFGTAFFMAAHPPL